MCAHNERTGSKTGGRIRVGGLGPTVLVRADGVLWAGHSRLAPPGPR